MKLKPMQLVVLTLCGLSLVGSSYYFRVWYGPLDVRSHLDAAVVNFVRPGLDLDVETIEVDADRKIKVVFTIADDRGLPLDLNGVMTPGPVRARFLLGTIPAGETQYRSYINRTVTSGITGVTAVQPTSDSGGTFTMLDMGRYRYTFGTLLPADADPTATHSIGIYSDRDLEEFELPDQIDNDVVHFRPDGGEVTVFRDVVRTENCNACHDPLALHGGFRRETELCVMCHTKGVIDPDTENFVDFKEMVHKIHRGADLPSVQAGIPYQIIGFRGSVHDYSTVHFPQDVRNCTTCHKDASQGLAHLVRPARQPCGSCHDDVDWVTGEHHPGGPQADDTLCSVCHIPEGDLEFDASVRGAHTIPAQSTQLPGVNLTIHDVVNSGPGDKPTVFYSVTNDAGESLNPATMNRLTLRIAGPTTEYTTEFSEDAREGSVPVEGGFTYTFETPLPADAEGSFAIAAEGREIITINPGTSKEQDVRDAIEQKVFYFPVTDGEAVPRRMPVATVNCEQCHKDLSLHGGNRKDVEYCVMCHRPDRDDSRRRPEEEFPAETIHFKFMIHRLHRGEELTRDYTIYGFGGSKHEFREVRFPGDLRNCKKCHLDLSFTLPSPGLLPTVAQREFFSPIAPDAAACLACHETIQAAAHAFLNIAPFAESCSVCHGEGAAFAVTKMHAR